MVRWIERHCVYGEGDRFGERVQLEPFQKAFLYHAYALTEAGERKHRRVMLEVPKGNGKTPISAWMALFELLRPDVVSPIIPVAAASFEQADLLFGDMKNCGRESPTLKQFLEVYDTEILIKGAPGRAFRVAAIAGTNDGQRPSGFFADETHEWLGSKERVHLVFANGTAKRAGSVQVNTTTPGSDLDSLCGRMHTYGGRVNSGEIDDESFLFVHYGAPDTYDLDKPDELRAAVIAANPAAGVFLNVDDVCARYYQMPRFEFERYHLGRWTRATDCWLPSGAWDACRLDDAERLTLDDLDPDLFAYVGVDMALRNDSVGIVVVQPGDDGRIRIVGREWRLDGETKVDFAQVENYLRELHLRLPLQSIAYDPAYFGRSAEVLEDEGLPMVEMPQSASRMIPACQQAYRLIVEGVVAHDGDPVLADHVLSAAQRETDSGWRLSKGKSRRKIDLCIALVMALWEATSTPEAASAAPQFYDLSKFVE